MQSKRTLYREHYDSGTKENWCFEVGGDRVSAMSDFEFKSPEEALEAAKLVIRCVKSTA